jgi:hypothetical protein
MTKRGMYLIGMLVLLFLANVAMLMGMTNWPQRTREGFANAMINGKLSSSAKAPMKPVAIVNPKGKTVEPFMDTLTSGFATAPIGSYDGINLAAGLPPAAQGFRQNHPNVPLVGPAVEIGPDNLFYFKNNAVGPECCDSTLSCDGGCVCTTPEQRDFINMRGGNRGKGSDF